MKKIPQILIVLSSLIVAGQIRLLIFNDFEMSNKNWFVLIMFGILLAYYSILYFVFDIKSIYPEETQKKETQNKETKIKKIGFK